MILGFICLYLHPATKLKEHGGSGHFQFWYLTNAAEEENTKSQHDRSYQPTLERCRPKYKASARV